MENKVTLIIPDVHLKWRIAEQIIAAVPHDEVIFLGDYFDDFGDDPNMFTETCDWLSSSVTKPNRTHLFGNHDVHYAFPDKGFRCSGFEQWKFFIVQDTVARSVWNRLKWYHILDNTWLLTHAGLHKRNLPEDIRAMYPFRTKFLAAIAEYLDEQLIQGARAVANNKPHWVFGAGKSRGGMSPVGGIIWCDFEREFHPIRGLHQIVGHTAQGYNIPNWCVMNNENEMFSNHPCHLFKPVDFNGEKHSFNVDLDVQGNMHYGIWDGKSLLVRNHEDLCHDTV